MIIARLQELLSNQNWMIHDLVDGDQITNEDEEILYTLLTGAKQEYKDLLEWKKAIEDACVVNWISITTPKATIDRLIAWNVEMALDPAISEEAQKLIEQGRREGTNEHPNH